MAQRASPLGMGQGPVELGRAYDLPGGAHKPADVKAPNSIEAKVSLIGGIAHANESVGHAPQGYLCGNACLFIWTGRRGRIDLHQQHGLAVLIAVSWGTKGRSFACVA